MTDEQLNGESSEGGGEATKLPTSDILHRLMNWLPDIEFDPVRIDIRRNGESEAVVKVYAAGRKEAETLYLFEPESAESGRFS